MSSTNQPSFVLDGAGIYGGSFYNVSGNVNQVFNSQASRTRGLQAQAAQSSLVIRSHKGPRQSVSWPYPTASSNQRYILGPETDGGATSSQHHFPPEQAVFYGVVRDDRNDSLQRSNVPQHSHSENGGSATGNVESNAYSIGGDMTQIKITSFGESGLDILYRHIVMEALHNSGERFPDPICHPGTRTKILQDLAFWSIDNAVEPMLWLHGLAGVGKSAIAQAFSVDCDNQGRLGASFFFKRGHPKRGTWDSLITTIAYQLARAVPEFSLPLQQAIEDDKLVVGRSISIQFDRLLVQPFRHLRELPLKSIVILDGLDECADHDHQQKILQLFIQAVQTGQLPFRLLVTSRPEPYLREVLEGDAMPKLCRPLVLDADESAYQDVRVFFRDEFSRIRSKFAKRGVDLGEEVWPPTNTIDRLVDKSSGIFIYATTVIRFVEDEYSHPADRLASLLSLDPSSTAPLDDLYTQILSRLTHGPDELRILHAVILPGGLYWAYPEDVDIILGLRPGRSRLMLRGLHALLSIPDHQTPGIFRSSVGVGALHATFSDYLHDPRRSGNWCIEIPWLHRDMLESIIRLLSNPDFTDRITLRRHMVQRLPVLLRGVTPSLELVGLLRNSNFQESIFLSCATKIYAGSRNQVWPQMGSLYPLDLIQVWEDQLWIETLADQMCPSRREPKPNIPQTFEFDSIYATIFREHPDALLLARTLLLFNLSPDMRFFFYSTDFMRILNLSFSTLKPFLVLRGHQSHLPSVHGGSVMDFLQDPRRAGSLYSAPQEILEHWMILWAGFAKRPIDSSGETLMPISIGLNLIKFCTPNPTLLHEMETLDLTYLCRQENIDQGAHKDLHWEYFHPDNFHDVVHWLSTFSQPPAHATASWKRQLEDIRRCVDKCQHAKGVGAYSKNPYTVADVSQSLAANA